MDAKTIPTETSDAARHQLKNLIEDSDLQNHVEHVETIATGLLILLVPGFLRISLSSFFHALPNDEPMMCPRFLQRKIHQDYEAAMIMADREREFADHSELFRVLSGKDNGPWNSKLSAEKKLMTLHKDGLQRCKDANSHVLCNPTRGNASMTSVPIDYVVLPHFQGYLPENLSDILAPP